MGTKKITQRNRRYKIGTSYFVCSQPFSAQASVLLRRRKLPFARHLYSSSSREPPMERNSSREPPSSVFHTTCNMSHVFGNEPLSILREPPLYPRYCTKTLACERTRSEENLASLAAATPSGFTKLSNRTTFPSPSELLPLCGAPVQFHACQQQDAASG